MNELRLSSFDGTELYVRKESAAGAKAAVVLCHGLGEHCGRYDHVACALNQGGISVYRYDHRGHGKSGGTRGYLNDWGELRDDLAAICAYARQDCGDLPLFLFGHSMGGMTVGLYLAGPHAPVSGAVLSSALTVDNAGAVCGVPDGQDPMTYLPAGDCSGLCTDQAVVQDFERDPLNSKANSFGLFYAVRDGVRWLSEHLAAISDPVLLLHGACDPVVLEKDSRDVFAGIRSQDKELHIYSRLYHEIWNESCKDRILAEVVRWITDRAQN